MEEISKALSDPETDLQKAVSLYEEGMKIASEALFELAKGYVDKPLAELQAEIGEPLSSSYVSSCLIPGGEDGELHYDGFTVYTVKSGDSETVQDVIAD